MFCGFEETVVPEKTEFKMGKREADRLNTTAQLSL